MIPILEEIAEKARWKTIAFQGKLHLSGRVLSPIEAQAAGMASKTIISKMASSISKDEEDESITIEDKINNFTPEDVLHFGAMQDRVLCQVVDKASQDGENWEKITLVQFEAQQNPNRNILWVGMISQADKNSIFEKAMITVKEAADLAESF